MDPPVMINGGGFRSGNTTPSLCNLSEIWPFPINLGGGGGNAASFGLGQLADNNEDNNDKNHNGSSNAYLNNNGDHLSADDPMVLDRRGNSKKRRGEDDASKGVSTSTPSDANGMPNDSDGKRLKALRPENENSEPKAEPARSSGKRPENGTKPTEPPKQDYIHVRARRGQATDSHSLAERARREKISERMKILQDLVPGCNKVIGKALVLDEIINYIQSLQRQVEFLSMKLEAVTSRSNPSPEGFPSKDFGQQTFDMPGMPFGSQPTREFNRGSSPEWLHMQIGGSFERTT